MADGLGVESTGLGGLRAVKAPPAPTTIAHGVLVGWSAARAEKRGRVWKSARELALDPERWEVTMRCERGYTKQLPDLAVWLRAPVHRSRWSPRAAGGARTARSMILEGWGDAILAGRYAAVLYDCANDSVARWINRLAKKVGLTRAECTVVVQPRAEEIATLTPAVENGDGPPSSNPQPSGRGAEATQSHEVHNEPGRAPLLSPPVEPEQRVSAPEPEPETPEAAVERERRYREILGIPEPKQRRRWHR